MAAHRTHGEHMHGGLSGAQPPSGREAHVRRNFWGKLKRVIARIPFAEDLVAAYYCAMDSRTPTRVRATLLGALAYFIMPVDAIPDVIAGLGFSDDAAVLAMVIGLVSSHITPEHRLAAARALGTVRSGGTVSGEGEAPPDGTQAEDGPHA